MIDEIRRAKWIIVGEEPSHAHLKELFLLRGLQGQSLQFGDLVTAPDCDHLTLIEGPARQHMATKSWVLHDMESLGGERAFGAREVGLGHHMKCRRDTPRKSAPRLSHG